MKILREYLPNTVMCHDIFICINYKYIDIAEKIVNMHGCINCSSMAVVKYDDYRKEILNKEN